jgi:hypothetical protein
LIQPTRVLMAHQVRRFLSHHSTTTLGHHLSTEQSIGIRLQQARGLHSSPSTVDKAAPASSGAVYTSRIPIVCQSAVDSHTIVIMSSSSSSSSSQNYYPAVISMALLALQNGLQPILTRRFTEPGINRSTVILVQEILKGIMAYSLLYMTTRRKESVWKGEARRASFSICAALYYNAFALVVSL